MEKLTVTQAEIDGFPEVSAADLEPTEMYLLVAAGRACPFIYMGRLPGLSTSGEPAMLHCFVGLGTDTILAFAETADGGLALADDNVTVRKLGPKPVCGEVIE